LEKKVVAGKHAEPEGGFGVDGPIRQIGPVYMVVSDTTETGDGAFYWVAWLKAVGIVDCGVGPKDGKHEFQ